MRDAGLFVQKCRYLLLKCSFCPEVMRCTVLTVSASTAELFVALSHSSSYSTTLLTHLRRQCEDSSNSQYRVRISSLIVADHRPKHVANSTVTHEVRLILYRGGVLYIIIVEICRLCRAVTTNEGGWRYYLVCAVSVSIC